MRTFVHLSDADRREALAALRLAKDGHRWHRTTSPTDGDLRRTTLEATLDPVRGNWQFATLTLGSGAAAMVLGRASEHPDGHRIVGGVSRAATEHHGLCVGDYDRMSTDAQGLLVAGMQLAQDLWADAAQEFDWQDMDRYVVHQVSQVHTQRTAQERRHRPGMLGSGLAGLPGHPGRHGLSLGLGRGFGCRGLVRVGHAFTTR